MKDSFGSVKLFGCKYEEDLVMHVDGNISKRKKKKSKEFKPIYGHTPLSENELDFLFQEKPEVVYIGTGYHSALPITEKAQKILEKYETFTMSTPEIIHRIEHEKKKAAAIIHVIC